MGECWGFFNNPQALQVFQGRLRIDAAHKFYKLAWHWKLSLLIMLLRYVDWLKESLVMVREKHCEIETVRIRTYGTGISCWIPANCYFIVKLPGLGCLGWWAGSTNTNLYFLWVVQTLFCCVLTPFVSLTFSPWPQVSSLFFCTSFSLILVVSFPSLFWKGIVP